MGHVRFNIKDVLDIRFLNVRRLIFLAGWLG